MAYGTAIASFNVEEFGTDRVARLTADEIAARRRAAAHHPFEHARSPCAADRRRAPGPQRPSWFSALCGG